MPADILNFGGTAQVGFFNSVGGHSQRSLYPTANSAWDMAGYDSADLVLEILNIAYGLGGSFTSDLKLQLFGSWQNGNEDPLTAGNLINPSPALWIPMTPALASATVTTSQTFPFPYLMQLERPFARYLRIGVEYGGFDGSGMTAGATVLFQMYGLGRKGV